MTSDCDKIRQIIELLIDRSNISGYIDASKPNPTSVQWMISKNGVEWVMHEED